MNPFFAPSPLPYQLPPFADIRDEHYRPAFERGIEEQLLDEESLYLAAALLGQGECRRSCPQSPVQRRLSATLASLAV